MNMAQITTKYQFEEPSLDLVKHGQLSDIRGIRTLFQDEECPNSENKFTDIDKGIYLDSIQTRISQRKGVKEKSSMDFALCIINHKVILVDAKFKVKSVDNIGKKDIDEKIKDSRDILCLVDYSLLNKYYILFRNSVLNHAQKNKIQRQFLMSPSYVFMTASEFYDLFE